MTPIRQRIAYVCINDYTVDQFLEEWYECGPQYQGDDGDDGDDGEMIEGKLPEDNEIREPTQEDYDSYLKEQLFASLCSGGYYREDIELGDKIVVADEIVVTTLTPTDNDND